MIFAQIWFFLVLNGSVYSWTSIQKLFELHTINFLPQYPWKLFGENQVNLEINFTFQIIYSTLSAPSNIPKISKRLLEFCDETKLKDLKGEDRLGFQKGCKSTVILFSHLETGTSFLVQVSVSHLKKHRSKAHKLLKLFLGAKRTPSSMLLRQLVPYLSWIFASTDSHWEPQSPRQMA